mgnify:CR=1 FL=1
MLFSCVNIARFIGVDSEEALTAATDKFLSRYVLVEQLAAERGMEMKSSSLQALDAFGTKQNKYYPINRKWRKCK